MSVNRRNFDSHIKSLVHFDFPYYAEPFDGGRDEINGNIFTRYGNAKFVGTEIPCDEIIPGTPKFGYRCLRTSSNSDYIAASNQAGKFTLNAGGNYEFECFIKALTQRTEGYIVRLMKDDTSMLSIAVDENMHIVVRAPALNLGTMTPESIESNTWYFLKVCLYAGKLRIYLSDTENPATDVDDDYDGERGDFDDNWQLPPNVKASGGGSYTAVTLNVDEMRLGGMNGYIDEFIMRDSQSNTGVPEEPYQGFLDVSGLGGYGNGVLNITLGSDTMINSYAIVKKCSGQTVTLGTIKKGQLAEFSAGGEVLFHVTLPKKDNDSETGYFAFRRILSVKSKTLTIDSPVIEEFDLAACLSTYYVQAIAVPNLNTFYMPAERTLNPFKFSKSYGGGIIVLRTKSDMTINGKIITAEPLSEWGPTRTDKQQGCHSDLVNRFIINRGGGIMLICGGTMTVSSGARIGASASARPGYGGDSAVYEGHSGAGTVGGGGGGSQYYTSKNVTYVGFYKPGEMSKATGAVMYRTYKATGVSEAGTQGITSGANGSIGGSGGACGNSNRGSLSGSDYSDKFISSGASVMIVANRLSLNENALRSGGLQGITHVLSSGNKSKVIEPGSGTGFCYIAAKELI